LFYDNIIFYIFLLTMENLNETNIYSLVCQIIKIEVKK